MITGPFFVSKPSKTTSRVLPERSAPTKRSERAVNEPRVEREQRLRAESELFEDPRAQILDEHVDAFEVLDEPRHRRGVPQVERDGALARVGGVEDGREIVEERRAPAPRVVAALGPLELYHVGAEPREDLAGKRPRQGLRDPDDFYPGERQTRHFTKGREVGRVPGGPEQGTTRLRSHLAFTPRARRDPAAFGIALLIPPASAAASSRRDG